MFTFTPKYIYMLCLPYARTNVEGNIPDDLMLTARKLHNRLGLTNQARGVQVCHGTVGGNKYKSAGCARDTCFPPLL